MANKCMVHLGPLCSVLSYLADVYPIEVVGYLLGGERPGETLVGAVYFAENLDRSPCSFTANPLDTIAAHRAAWNLGIDVVGVFHTHPRSGSSPSQSDLEGMRRWPLTWVINGRGGTLSAWRLMGGHLESCYIECS
ncbi:MAG: M67 family metallopeptidase [Desulfurococcales archaeon]|nr:M67 family metallopeptidase [Desulfurococcales archaeon]